jgi:hypothetical protein
MSEDEALEQRARRIARSHGLIARKSRWRSGTMDNRGGFQLLRGNWIVAGEKFNMTAAEVITYCEG